MSSDSDNTTPFDAVVTAVKTFESSDLFKLLKVASSEIEKKSVALQKQAVASQKVATKATAAKKTGSMPKGAIPPQLKKPRAWVEFTLKSALENGWESFTVVQKKKDKETNTVTEEQIEMSGSVLYNGAHIYKDSVSEKSPEGRQLNHKEAMSLSKQRKEASHATFAVFDTQYVDETSDDDKSVTSSTSSKKIVVKKTAAEKEAEAAAKKKATKDEKAVKKAKKDAEKEAKKVDVAAEKEAKKVEKAEKIEKKTVPVAAVKKVVVKPATPVATTTTAAVAILTPQKKALVAPKEDVPNDGMVHPWTYKAKKYLRNADGETWTVGADGGVGEWIGLYDAATNKLNTSAAAPVFEDDE